MTFNMILVGRLDDNAEIQNNIGDPLVLMQLDCALSELDSTDSDQIKYFLDYQIKINNCYRYPRNGSLVLTADKQVLSYIRDEENKVVTLVLDSDNYITFEEGE